MAMHCLVGGRDRTDGGRVEHPDLHIHKFGTYLDGASQPNNELDRCRHFRRWHQVGGWGLRRANLCVFSHCVLWFRRSARPVSIRRWGQLADIGPECLAGLGKSPHQSGKRRYFGRGLQRQRRRIDELERYGHHQRHVVQCSASVHGGLSQQQPNLQRGQRAYQRGEHVCRERVSVDAFDQRGVA